MTSREGSKEKHDRPEPSIFETLFSKRSIREGSNESTLQDTQA
jgi:hypothetical protein